ncbi:MAG: aminopeptidase P family protein [Phycisphaerae bacterium]
MKQKNLNSNRIACLFANKALVRAPAVLLTTQPNIFYFTNFTGHDSWAILTPEKTIILTDGRYTLQAKQESPLARVFVRKGPMVPFFNEALAKTAIKKVAFLGDEISLGLMDKLTNTCKKTKWLKMSSRSILDLRVIKSPDEIVRICRAIAIAQEAYTGLLSDLKPGMTENEAAAELEYRLRMWGAEKASFETIIACGPNAAKPHARTSNSKLVAGKPIVIDFGALANGYCSDLTRTICLGKMPPALKDIYKICLEAQLAGIEAIKPGVRADTVDAAARKVITLAGYGKFFNHGLGHGLGLEVHEGPTLNRISRDTLQPGMIVTVEPGIYIPGKGGVRIEDDVLVTETGFKVLSSLPKEPDCILL